MLKWLSGKINDAGDRAAEKEIDKYIQHLAGCDHFKNANNLIVATALRLNLQDSGQIPRNLIIPELSNLADMEEYLKRSEAEGLIMKLINAFKANNQVIDSSAMRIWLITMWGYRIPILRPKVKEMWKILNDSLIEIDRAMTASSQFMKQPFPENFRDELTTIPPVYAD
jgi:hypothetical protein